MILDFARALRARRRAGEGWAAGAVGLLRRQNQRYGGFAVHLAVLVIALGVAGSHAWSVQKEVTLNRGESVEVAGYRVRFDGLDATEESNHFKVTGNFTVSRHGAGSARPAPARPQVLSPGADADRLRGLPAGPARGRLSRPR